MRLEDMQIGEQYLYSGPNNEKCIIVVVDNLIATNVFGEDSIRVKLMQDYLGLKTGVVVWLTKAEAATCTSLDSQSPNSVIDSLSYFRQMMGGLVPKQREIT